MLGSLQLLPSGAGEGEASQLTGQTVFEAQQGGELVQLQDDASYALDGLSSSSSLSTQRDSAVTLAEMLASRKGRLALRKDGLAQQYLSALAKLKVGRDPVLALAAAASLLALSQEDAHPAYAASTAAAVLAEQLLQEAHNVNQAAADNPGAARLQRLLHNGSLLRVPGGAAGSQPPGSASQRALADDDEATVARARHEALTSTQQGVLLIALAHSTGAHDAARLPYTEVVRGKLLRHGVLERLSALLHTLCGGGAGSGGGGGAAERSHPRQSAGSPTCALDAGLIAANAWVLGATLVVLENATFTAPDSAALLVGAAPSGAAAGDDAGSSRPAPGSAGLPQLLVHLLEPLGAEVLGGCAACTQALHGCLALLMNLTHGTTRGGVVAVCRAGGAPAIITLLQRLLPSWRDGTPLALRAEVLRRVEVVSVALGVLINLASTEAAVCAQLTAQQPSSGGGRRGGTAAPSNSALPLLCSILNATGEGIVAAGGPAAGAAPGRAARRRVQQGGSPGSSSGGGEGESPASGAAGSAGAGEDESDTGQASIVEAYAAMLGGFLMRGNPRLQALAASLLSGGSLAPVVAAIRRCLSFYLTAGAITESTRDKLVQLLQELQGAGGGAGPEGGDAARACVQ